MNTLKQTIQKGTQDIVLSAEEREEMRASLSAYMEYHPVREKVGSTRMFLFSNPFSYFRHHHFVGGALIAVLVTTSTYGVSSAAEGALPGDLLYVVKVDVNEELKTAFLNSDEERIAWEQERAARRLTEASELAAVGKLDSKAKEEVSRRFAQHAQSVVEQTQAVEASDPVLAASAASDFEISLDTHEAVLARLAVDAPEEEGAQARGLVEQVRGTVMEANKVRAEVEDRITRTLENNTPIASVVEGESVTSTALPQEEAIRDRALTRANERAERARERAKQTLTELAGELITTQAQEQLTLAEGIEAQARTRQQEGDTLGAYQLFKDAATRYQKVIHSIKMAQVLDSPMLPGSAVASAPSEEVASVAVVADDAPASDDSSVQNRGAELKERLKAVRATTDNRETLTLLGEARASALRGEVAQNLGDTEAATRFFDEAFQFVTHAEELGGASQEGEVTQPQEPAVPTEASTSPALPDEAVVPPDMPELDVVIVYHEFASGTHRYSGFFYTPTPCFSLKADALVAESFPVQVTLQLTTTEGSGACAMVLDKKAFSIEVAASQEARLEGVSVNGQTSKWKSVEGPRPEEEGMEPLSVQSVPSVNTQREAQSSGTSSLLERAFEATAALLRPQ